MTTSTSNSLLLLAVKRSMAVGAYKLATSNTFSSFNAESALSVGEVAANEMSMFIDVLIDEINEALPVSSYRKEIAESLAIDRDFETYQWGEASQLVCDSFYANNKGTFNTFVYSFNPLGNGNTIQTEYMRIDLKFTLADICICLTKCKKNWFSSRTFIERRYIKPSVNFADFVCCLSIAISPILAVGLPVQTPANAADELKAQAAQVPNTMPSDAPRRTIYNPMKKMNVVVTDPRVLKLLPGFWETVTTKDVVAATNSAKWEFDQ
ncbi:hypothetical protein TVAG_013720 [Trichomonas vaginalis G3]|uniref:Uncharacterized protein n=1 Tax=Trichomonas vaginalis (strain ATCC PRA-98 / G3) TaxID=412133 RepID=A2DDC8_TRIV3|nr:hypothetical protein TVAGG3_0986610 [Trichomonas vaginalis G3]EAY21607.1 hypothetical protein TVAG_013720 [Trichomonas vaginalis G3]KAI5489717.1 hypothetical protein TVAGG3_0986610 [Trichomonas vaginalis G3]|eukprot:XP_001582593.1 hypothetical protein [Trichomonas vaginalis G3]